MPRVGARVQNLGHLRILNSFSVSFSFMESFIFEQQVLFGVDFLCDFRPKGLVPQGGAGGKNLEHLRIFFWSLFFFFYGIICI